MIEEIKKEIKELKVNRFLDGANKLVEQSTKDYMIDVFLSILDNYEDKIDIKSYKKGYYRGVDNTDSKYKEMWEEFFKILYARIGPYEALNICNKLKDELEKKYLGGKE